jgi:hypothetical protein
MLFKTGLRVLLVGAFRLQGAAEPRDRHLHRGLVRRVLQAVQEKPLLQGVQLQVPVLPTSISSGEGFRVNFGPITLGNIFFLTCRQKI